MKNEPRNGFSAHRSPLRVRHLLPLAASVFAFATVFGWAVFRGKYFVGGDVFFYTYPMRSVAWEMIREGRLPLWTPHVLSGYPLL